MIFLDELNYMMLYKKKFHLPINEKDKRKGSAIFLLTPNFESSIKIINNPLLVNNRYFESYYIEKSVTYYITSEGYVIDVSDASFKNVLNENRLITNTELILSEASDEVLNDPKRYVRSLKLKMNRPKYKLNQLSDKERNDVGITKDNSGSPNNVSGPQMPNPQIPQLPPKPVITENAEYFGSTYKDYMIEQDFIRYKIDEEGNSLMTVFSEGSNAVFNQKLQRLLYKERLKTNADVIEIYNRVRDLCPFITKTFIDINKYKSRNVFIDLSYYNQTFFNNNIYKKDLAVNLYFELMDRFIRDTRISDDIYNKKTVFVPLLDWISDSKQSLDFNYSINPLSIIYRLLRKNSTELKKWDGIDFVFLTDYGYFKIDFGKIDKKDMFKITLLIEKILSKEPIQDLDNNKESTKSIIANIVSKIEDSQKIKVDNLTGKSGEIDKDELVHKIEKAAAVSTDTDETLNELDNDDYMKRIIDTLAAEEEGNIKINAARASRMNALQQDFLGKSLKGTTVRDMIDPKNSDKELPVTSLKIDTVNEEWKDLKYVNFEKTYNIDEDIMLILNSFSKKSMPLSVRNIKVEDTSTSEDLIETYIVNMEDSNGQRFTVKFDVPKFRDNKFMLLRGNDKTINGQSMLLPIIKTDEDTVQIVSNRNKIFIRRFGTTSGKSLPSVDRIMKTFKKYDGNKIKISLGDNTKICSKYELPIDYIDLASVYNKIETSNTIYYFNQDEIREKYNNYDKTKIPIGVLKNGKQDLIYLSDYSISPFSSTLATDLRVSDTKFADIYDKTSLSTRYTYSKASILNTQIPLIVIMGYNEGLIKSLNKANIHYTIQEKRPSINKDVSDMIKFKDGYLLYDLDYNSSLLLNGLKECNTEDYSISEINNKSMYLDFLDLFGGRILADGLDNFWDTMIDPMTEDVLRKYKLPTDYIEILAYANMLLSDNKYFKHTDYRSKRYRSNEIVAGYLYKALAEAYGDYVRDVRRGKKATLTMKQSKVIDNVLLDPTCSDLSSLNALTEAEAINAVSTKGLSGMNSDRSYSLDKRTYDESMINVLALSTGFAGNVGITRQSTIDMNIEGKRGYIKVDPDPNKLSVTKTFAVTEALTPYGTTRDDPFRSAMTFIQTSKHGMRIQEGTPLLITNGADQALPYIGSNTFSFKAKQNGKVIEKTDDYVIVEYSNGQHDFVDLRSTIKKNSNGGFFITIKLDTDLKLGSVVKKDQILAYDKLSFSDKIGDGSNIAYNLGCLTKIAILNTDEGFEDSAIISEYLSNAMASEVVVKKEVVLPKNTNIYNMVKKGQPIQEGDPLLIFQNAFEEDDVNTLLKNLVDDEKEISDLGRIRLKSKITGFVEDIKVYRTVEKDELSDSLRKTVNELEKPNNNIKKSMAKYSDLNSNVIQSTDKLEATGKLKNAKDGVLIEFYLKYLDQMSIGDKLIYYSALKGVTKTIFPLDKEPHTDFRPKEKIHSLLSMGSVSGRMVCSIKLNLGLNKVLVEMDRKIKDKLGIKWTNLDE